MAPTITWDASFEASPADTDEAKYGATKIRQLKLAISERLELEMEFKTGTQPLSKAGKIAVVYSGTTVQIAALSGGSTGAFAWDTDLKVLKRYNGATWDIMDIHHGALYGLADDDHPQYLNLTKTAQTLTEDLLVTAGKKIDGRDIGVDGTKLDNLEATCSGLKFMATTVNKVDWTAATDWTDVDISANTGTDTAKAALLSVQLDFDANIGQMTGLFRKNGSSETAILPRVRGWSQYAYSAWRSACMLIVECDGSEIFEAKLQTDLGTPVSIVFKVDLIGYIV